MSLLSMFLDWVTKTEFFETTFIADINSMLYIEVKLGSTGETKTYRIGSQSKVEEVDKSEHLEKLPFKLLINCPLRPTLIKRRLSGPIV